jgi:hypothetical protein
MYSLIYWISSPFLSSPAESHHLASSFGLILFFPRPGGTTLAFSWNNKWISLLIYHTSI